MSTTENNTNKRKFQSAQNLDDAYTINPPKEGPDGVIAPLTKYEYHTPQGIENRPVSWGLHKAWRVLTGTALLDRYEKFATDVVVITSFFCLIWFLFYVARVVGGLLTKQ
eukprot:UN07218